ncbi:MAG: hypothetical protein EZS28_054208, partial [Streblomastix strix]
DVIKCGFDVQRCQEIVLLNCELNVLRGYHFEMIRRVLECRMLESRVLCDVDQLKLQPFDQSPLGGVSCIDECFLGAMLVLIVAKVSVYFPRPSRQALFPSEPASLPRLRPMLLEISLIYLLFPLKFLEFSCSGVCRVSTPSSPSVTRLRGPASPPTPCKKGGGVVAFRNLPRSFKTRASRAA